MLTNSQKKGKNKKHLAKLLVCLGLLSTTIFDVQAEDNHEISHQIENSMIVEYSFEGNKIREVAEANINGEEISINRLIFENGAFEMIITSADNQERVEGNVDYELFEKITNDYLMSLNTPITYGSDVTGSQYKHIYIGTAGVATLNSASTDGFLSASLIIAALTNFISAPVAIILELANLIRGGVGGDVDEVYVYSDTYEVQFSYDGGYYTHCYHQIIEEYDSGGHLLDAYEEYYQVIGG